MKDPTHKTHAGLELLAAVMPLSSNALLSSGTLHAWAPATCDYRTLEMLVQSKQGREFLT